ncbi:hypothetical protein BDQ17DRAFT_1433748 [Cyathus striatus]|nr:hypothetical protein BDQ17DRAFT_1433748 [Cyathus striatus]
MLTVPAFTTTTTTAAAPPLVSSPPPPLVPLLHPLCVAMEASRPRRLPPTSSCLHEYNGAASPKPPAPPPSSPPVSRRRRRHTIHCHLPQRRLDVSHGRDLTPLLPTPAAMPSSRRLAHR